ncbi:Ubiquitin conjugation factor E4, partial [Kickxella alabastrina]
MATTQKAEKTLEQWQDDALSTVLLVTLDNTNPKRSRRCYLGDVAQELQEEGAAALITKNTLERVLVARLEEERVVGSGLGVFEYLLGSWQAVQGVIGNLAGAKGRTLDAAVRTERVQALTEARTLLVSYMGLALQIPDMFPQFGRSGRRVIADALLAESPDDPVRRAVIDEWLPQLAARFAGDDMAETIGPV